MIWTRHRVSLTSGCMVLIGIDGLIVVRESKPFKHLVDRIVVSKSVSSSLLMALNIQCSHPTSYQLK